jgi:hypothetical protein
MNPKKWRGAPLLAVLLLCFHGRAMADDDENAVQWGPLLRESLFFLGTQHTFRVATDPGVRDGLKGSFLGGYADSVANLHGWADGDPFFVNYIGHPMQGAIAGDLFIHNDPRYRKAEFGKNRPYWTGRMRAIAYSWAYSAQFEIGPLSEASIGHTQQKFPQQGFVDHVITPVLGGGWMLAEDALDRFVIKKIEARTKSPWVKMVARGFLNPSRTFANCMELQAPWHRETRGGIFGPPDIADPDAQEKTVQMSAPQTSEPDESSTPAFEFSTTFNQTLLGAGARNVACAGGGGSAVFNLSSFLGVEADVSGCKMLGLESNLSGDALMFAAGPRFSYRTSGGWTPWMNVLAGGEKVTQEWFSPAVKQAVLAAAPRGASLSDLHAQYTRQYASTGFRVALGGGLDWDLNRSVALRLGNLEYSRVWMHPLNGESYPNDLRLTMGVVVKFSGE